MEQNDNKKKLLVKKDIFLKLWNKGITLFFFNLTRKWNNLNRDYDYTWIPENSTIESKVHGENSFSQIFNEISFIYGKPLDDSTLSSSNTEMMQIEFEEFDPINLEHLKALFNLHLSNRYDSKNKFACRELLWYLNNYFIYYEVVCKVLSEFDEQSIRPFFINELKTYAVCLSIPKQNLIKKIISRFGGSFTIYIPNQLLEALKLIEPNINIESDWSHNIFDLVHKATCSQIDKDGNSYNVFKENINDNFFLKIRRWLIDENYIFSDYDMLTRMLRLFSPNLQMKILNRYFLAIKNEQASFDIENLKKFKENRFDNWSIYYHSVSRASKPILIGLQLICDNLITFLSSGGKALQTINGTLDMAYAQSNISSPSVDFQLDKIVPVCNGGAVPNHSGFKGFICYEVVLIFNDELFYDNQKFSNLVFSIIGALSNYRYSKTECSIHGSQISDCDKLKINKDACKVPQCQNYITKELNKWAFVNPSESICQVINLFLTKNYLEKDKSKDIYLEDLNQNALEVKQKIIEFLNCKLIRKESHGNYPEGFVIPVNSNYTHKILYKKILQPIWMTIEPRNNAYIGLGLLAPKIGVNIEEYGPSREGNNNIKSKETKYIKPIIISSIQSIVNKSADPDGKFYLDFDNEMLRKLQATFYSTNPSKNGDTYDDRDLGFLQRAHTFYVSYCAPEYTGETNKATNFPYFWCRGKECYMNALTEQTLS